MAAAGGSFVADALVLAVVAFFAAGVVVAAFARVAFGGGAGSGGTATAAEGCLRREDARVGCAFGFVAIVVDCKDQGRASHVMHACEHYTIYQSN